MRVAVGWVGGGVQGWLRLCAGTSEMFFEMREYAKGCVCVCVCAHVCVYVCVWRGVEGMCLNN